MSGAVAGALLAAVLAPGTDVARPLLSPRVRRIVLHVLGGPSYHRAEMRFAYRTPQRTQARWSRRFGAHWIVWTDGSLWPRHPRRGEPVSFVPPVEAPADETWTRRIAEQAAPVYSHLYNGNSGSVGIEVAHSGRSDDPFPDAQVRSLAWLVQTLLAASGGRLTPASIQGHKDLDGRPAYVYSRCQRAGCPVFADSEGRPFLRRVDPPEGLFRALAAHGLAIPRPHGATDDELRRAETHAGWPLRSAEP
jgi:hypothetical protein